MTIHRIHRNQQGITLIEVLAAVLLLGAAAVLSVQLFQTVNLANRKNDLQAAALRLAQSEINRLLILAEDRPPPLIRCAFTSSMYSMRGRCLIWRFRTIRSQLPLLPVSPLFPIIQRCKPSSCAA